MKTVFLSLGNPYNNYYEVFAKGLVEWFAKEGFALKSVGYNVGAHQGPMTKIIEVFQESHGAVIVAFKRIEISKGTEKETENVDGASLATPWNHIEAAMAFDCGLPILMIVEKGLRRDGMFEYGPNWYIYETEMKPEMLDNNKFRLLFAEWREAVARPRKSLVNLNPAELTLGRLLSSLRVGHVCAIVGGVAALLFIAFEWGMHVAGK